MEIAVVVLNWNAFDFTCRCVESALAQRGVGVRVRVVDNASPDGSGERLRERFGAERVALSPENTGYAGGMNAGIEWWLRETDLPFCLLLTQDVELEPDALLRMAEVMEAVPEAGAVGPRVQHGTGPLATVSAGGFVDPERSLVGHLRRGQAEEPYAADWVDGGCMLLRREAVERVGSFDERYFMYFEENDLCQRLRKAGWRVMVAPGALAVHETASLPGPHYFYYMARNRYLFFREHFAVGFLRVAAAHALDTARTAAGLVRRVVDPRLRAEAGDQWRALARQSVGSVLGTHDLVRGRLGRQRF